MNANALALLTMYFIAQKGNQLLSYYGNEKLSASHLSDKIFRQDSLSQTQTLPNYLDHQTVKRYHEVRRSVEQRLHSCRVQGVVSMFNELSNEEKEECLKILQKTT